MIYWGQILGGGGRKYSFDPQLQHWGGGASAPLPPVPTPLYSGHNLWTAYSMPYIFCSTPAKKQNFTSNTHILDSRHFPGALHILVRSKWVSRSMGGARLFLLGGKRQGMWGQILAIEGLLMDAWTITGGGGAAGGKARARGVQLPPPPR